MEGLLEGSRDQLPWLRLSESEHTAVVNAISFDATGNKLFTAGNDKVVLSWKRREGQKWFYTDTIRWQVQRAERGVIRCIDEANGKLAIGGVGADGLFGEIAIVDHERGLWLAPAIAPNDGHRFEIHQVHWVGQDRKQIASIDSANGVVVWTEVAGGAWQPKWLRRSGLVQETRRQLAALGNNQLVWRTDGADGQWNLQVIDIPTGNVVTSLTPAPARNELESALGNTLTEFEKFLRSQNRRVTKASMLDALSKYGRLVTLEASRDGNYILAGDDMGYFYLWDRTGRLLAKHRCSFTTGLVTRVLRSARKQKYLPPSQCLPMNVLRGWKFGLCSQHYQSLFEPKIIKVAQLASTWTAKENHLQ